MSTYEDIDPTWGGTYKIIANKATGYAHAADDDENGTPRPFCGRTEQYGRLGRTVVGVVEGYRNIRDFDPGALPEGITLCPACHDLATEILTDREEAYAEVQRDGAAAGRTIRYTLVIEEQVGPEALLYSIKDAEETMRWRLADVLDKHPGARLSVEFTDETEGARA